MMLPGKLSDLLVTHTKAAATPALLPPSLHLESGTKYPGASLEEGTLAGGWVGPYVRSPYNL